MARLPQPGSDVGTWGQILNEYLSQTHTSTGDLKADIVGADQLAPNAVTSDAIAPNAITVTEIANGIITEQKLDSAVQTKLNTIGSGGVNSVNTRTGVVTLDKTDVGLGNVDNTSDTNKPISSATQIALNTKATDTLVVHLAGAETVSGAKTFSTPVTTASPVNNGHAATKQYVDDLVDTITGGGGTVSWGGITGTISDQTDLTSVLAQKAAISSLAAVATSGSYNDLLNKPTIPAVSGTNTGDQTLNYNSGTGALTISGSNGNAVSLPVGGGAITYADLPSGSTLTVSKSGSTWPARPTSRADVVVHWKGPDPSPSIVSSGTGGMLDNVDIRYVTP